VQQRGEVALGAFIGLAMFAAVGILGLRVLEGSWPAYAAAVPFKAYSAAMLCARLGVAVAACVAAGAAAARVTPASSWAAGMLLLLLSLYDHVLIVWRDYPVWYHLTYLALLVPLTGLAGSIHRTSRDHEVKR